MLVFEHEISWAMRRLVLFARKIDIYKDVDLVIAYGLPFSGIVLGSVFARLLGKPLIVEYGDPIDTNPARDPSLLERFANRWIMKRATRVIVTNKNYAKYAAQKRARHIDYLPPVASLSMPSEDDGQVFKHLAGLGEGMKAFYAGMFYDRLRSGAALVEAVELMKGRLTFVHAGAPYRKAEGCTNYRNIGYLEQSLASSYLYWADIALYFANDTAFQTPSKIVEIAYIARFVLAIGNSFTEFERNLLSKTQVVFVANEPLEIVAAFGRLALVLKTERKSVSDFRARVSRLADYNANVFLDLEHILRGCAL